MTMLAEVVDVVIGVDTVVGTFEHCAYRTVRVLDVAQVTRVLHDHRAAGRDDGRRSAGGDDDGTGFDAPKTMRLAESNERIGLLGMTERIRLLGGTCTIESERRKGTTVKVYLPSYRSAQELRFNDSATQPEHAEPAHQPQAQLGSPPAAPPPGS